MPWAVPAAQILRKPIGRLSVNWSHPSNYRLRSCWLMNENAGLPTSIGKDIYQLTAPTGITGWYGTPTGMSVDVRSTASQYLAGSVAKGSADPYSIVLSFILPTWNMGGTVGLLSWHESSVNSPNLLIQLFDPTLRIYVDSNYRESSMSLSKEVLYHVAVGSDGANYDFVLNGKLLSSYSGGSKNNSTNIFWGYGYNGYCSTLFLGTQLYDAKLSVAKLIELTTHPYGTPSNPRFL